MLKNDSASESNNENSVEDLFKALLNKGKSPKNKEELIELLKKLFETIFGGGQNNSSDDDSPPRSTPKHKSAGSKNKPLPQSDNPKSNKPNPEKPTKGELLEKTPQNVKDYFNSLDTDGNGTLSAEEAKASDLWNEFTPDEKADGITQQEYWDAWKRKYGNKYDTPKNQQPKDPPKPKPEPAKAEAPKPKTNAPQANSNAPNFKSNEYKFNKIDSNKDTYISRKEYESIGLDDFDKVDANGDGLVTLDEYHHYHKDSVASDGLKDQMKSYETFNGMDTDGSGGINKNELPYGQGTFAGMDADGSGEISFEEYLNYVAKNPQYKK